MWTWAPKRTSAGAEVAINPIRQAVRPPRRISRSLLMSPGETRGAPFEGSSWFTGASRHGLQHAGEIIRQLPIAVERQHGADILIGPNDHERAALAVDPAQVENVGARLQVR